jgi:hypothetical protein
VLVVAAPEEPDGEIEAAAAGVAVVVGADFEVGETVGLPGASVVLSVVLLSTPLISVIIMVSPSVTVVSGTPTSGSGAVEGVWAADCVGRAIVNATSIKRHSSAFRTLLAVTVSIFSLP